MPTSLCTAASASPTAGRAPVCLASESRPLTGMSLAAWSADAEAHALCSGDLLPALEIGFDIKVAQWSMGWFLDAACQHCSRGRRQVGGELQPLTGLRTSETGRWQWSFRPPNQNSLARDSSGGSCRRRAN
eukprot:1027493-Prymnesium_polylepis.2